ncbi:MAG TPA: response regulator [Methylomirabilota bacterium]|nr:response regulator [Methylomirabilota bacterium]
MAKILVVDDEPSIRELFAALLSMAGHEVTAVSSAQEARCAWEEEEGRFNVLVTDFWMPGEKGDALAVALCRESARMGCVIVTGHNAGALSLAEFRDRIIVLNKPLNAATLNERIMTLLSRRAENRSLPD